MDYRILEANSAAKLMRLVNQHIDRGWKPLGGVSVAPSNRSSRWWYYQAVVHDGEEMAVERKPGFGEFD